MYDLDPPIEVAWRPARRSLLLLLGVSCYECGVLLGDCTYLPSIASRTAVWKFVVIASEHASGGGRGIVQGRRYIVCV